MRCPVCAMKECCGANMDQEITRLRAATSARIGFYKDKATTYSMCVEAWNAAPRGEK